MRIGVVGIHWLRQSSGYVQNLGHFQSLSIKIAVMFSVLAGHEYNIQYLGIT